MNDEQIKSLLDSVLHGLKNNTLLDDGHHEWYLTCLERVLHEMKVRKQQKDNS